MQSAVAAALGEFGRIDVLVNNAHSFALNVPLEETTDALMDESWRSAALGSLYFMQACFPALKQRGGKIINIGSGSGLDGDAGSAAYVAAPIRTIDPPRGPRTESGSSLMDPDRSIAGAGPVDVRVRAIATPARRVAAALGVFVAFGLCGLASLQREMPD